MCAPQRRRIITVPVNASGGVAGPATPVSDGGVAVPVLFFDVATLSATGIRVPGLTERSFAELGLVPGEALDLAVRELTLAGAPKERDATLVTDRLVVADASALVYTRPARVDVWAERIEGQLNVHSPGIKGAKGATGSTGKPAVIRLETVPDPPPDPNEPFTKPGRPEKVAVLVTPAGQGGPGRPGSAGGPGGRISVRYASLIGGIKLTAPGGPGGDPGAGGPGGDGKGFASGPRGSQGTVRGADGPAGTATSNVMSTPLDLWGAYASWTANRSQKWAAHRLAVAEYHYRLGTSGGLAVAKEQLLAIADRPGSDQSWTRARRLAQQLWENCTYAGVARDIDVTPDIAFAGQTLSDLLDVALTLVGDARNVASFMNVQSSFAQTMHIAAQQSTNHALAAEARVGVAESHLVTAMSSTDLARARVVSMNKRIDDLWKEISAERDEFPSFFEVAGKIVVFAAAIAGAVAGIATGVGAVVSIGAGFALVSSTAGAAMTIGEAVSEVKAELKESGQPGFTKSIDEVKSGVKSIFHVGELAAELGNLGATHPSPKVREVAESQRQVLLLQRDIGLHQQMEKEAQLGVAASKLERDGAHANAKLCADFANQLDDGVRLDAEPVLRALLASIQDVLDALSIDVFRTQRAREIYFGLDPIAAARYDLGQIHPDRARLLSRAKQLEEISALLNSRAVEITQLPSLADELDAGASGLNQTPMPLWFSTDDAAHLDSLRTTGRLVFEVVADDVAEENGSDLYEVRFDAAEVVLHGARINGSSGQSIRLRQFGRWSFRRRPEPDASAGTAVTFALPPREVHLAARSIAAGVEATVDRTVNPRGLPPMSVWGRGIAGQWELFDEGGIDMSDVTKVEIGFKAQALASSSFRVASATPARRLRPLAGWSPDQSPTTRPPTFVPARGWRNYGSGSGVVAVGAALI